MTDTREQIGQVATEVCGLVVQRAGYPEPVYYEEFPADRSDAYVCMVSMFNPRHDNDHAMRVLDALAHSGWSYTLSYYVDGDDWGMKLQLYKVEHVAECGDIKISNIALTNSQALRDCIMDAAIVVFERG